MTTMVLPDRVRLRYEKVGRVRFTSQRDLARIIERSLRRATLPMAKSEGFSPRPLLSFGLALPTGCASLAEYVDLRLDPDGSPGTKVVPAGSEDPESLQELTRSLTDLLPVGVSVTAAAALLGSEPSLQEAVTSCDWELEVLGVSPAEMTGLVGQLLASETVTVVRDRKGRTVTDDIRPNIVSLHATETAVRDIEGLGSVAGLRASLTTRPRGVRPAELTQALGKEVTLVGACRTHQWIENEDRTVREEPLSCAGKLPVGPSVRTEVQDR